MLDCHHRFMLGHGEWLEVYGAVRLVGGWAQVPLDEDYAALIEPDYLVFVVPYEPVQLFVQNRTERSFEIHMLPVSGGRRPLLVDCGYRIVGRRASRREHQP